jgi:hypothetical protein
MRGRQLLLDVVGLGCRHDGPLLPMAALRGAVLCRCARCQADVLVADRLR